MNPVVFACLDELTKGSRVINAIVKDKVNAGLFKEGKIPSCPLTGIMYLFLPVAAPVGEDGDIINARWCSVRTTYAREKGQSSLRTYQKRSTQGGPCILQSESISKSSEAQRNFLCPHDYVFANRSCHGSPWFCAGHGYPYPYIFKILKEAGVSDPYGKIVEAAATANADSLWTQYEEAAGNKIPLDELLSTLSVNEELGMYANEEEKQTLIDNFRQEYFFLFNLS